MADTARPVRWGLSLRLFAILILLGAVAVLVTGVLGYVRARDALEQAIFNQLTAARETKARQVETYFRTIHAELRLLATSKMVVEATREFRVAVRRTRPRADVRPRCDGRSSDWYGAHFVPEMQPRARHGRRSSPTTCRSAPAPYYLQYHYIVANPHPEARRRPGRRCRRRQRLQQAARHLSSADARRRRDRRLLRLHDRRPEVRPPDLHGRQGGGFRHLAAGRSLPAAPTSPPPSPVAPRRADRSAVCLEDFAPYAPSGGAPTAFMAAPVIDQGVVIGVLIAQLSIEEIDNVVTGDRRWRQEGFGATGEAYLVGPDHLRALRPTGVLRESRPLLRRAEGRRRVGRGDRRHPPLRHAGPASSTSTPKATRAALAGVEGTGEIIGYRGVPTLASWGPLAIAGVKWALVAKIDSAEAFAPIYRLRQDLMIVGGLALLVVIADRRLAVARAARAVARAHRRREALRRRRLRRQGGGPHARRDRPALPRLQRHGRRAARARTSSSRTRTARTRSCC